MPGAVAVPDASVLLKWVLDSDDERDRVEALALKEAWLSGACEIVVPSLWIYEVGNILGLKRPSTAKATLQAMVDLEIEEAPASEYFGEIYRLMKAHRVTFYDAAYHALAIQRRGTLITADAAYARKVSASGRASTLADWRSAIS